MRLLLLLLPAALASQPCDGDGEGEVNRNRLSGLLLNNFMGFGMGHQKIHQNQRLAALPLAKLSLRIFDFGVFWTIL